jgi:hypothetical protein
VSDVKICPTCSTEYPLSERFCPRDGTALRSADVHADLVGNIVAERYHVIKKLGEGGMGTVYLAEHVKMGRKSALKVMNPGMNRDADAVARFNREAANASRLNHPNICAIYDFGETPDGLIYLAMEFIEGDALTALIERAGALAPARAATILHQSADALAVAHDYGIVHRDLKPDNIMISKGRDGADVAKVVDFGIAKASSSEAQKVTKTGLVVGTPEYMSPEQLAGDTLDGRSDIYSLALVGFNMLTGTLPFPSNSAQEAMIMRLTDRPRRLDEMKPEVAWPEDLQAVMDRALARDFEERYKSAAEFGRDFAKAIAAMPSTSIAEDKTQVIGAAAASPKTRVAGASAGGPAAAPAAAAPAPTAAGSNKTMIGAGAAVVAAVAIGAFMMMKGDAPPLTADPTPPPASVEAPAATDGSAPAPGAASSVRELSRPQSANPAADSRRTEPDPATATPPVATDNSDAADLAEIERLYQKSEISDAENRRVVALANRLLADASGNQRALLLWRRGMARLQLGEEGPGCEDLRTSTRAARSDWKDLAVVDDLVSKFCSAPSTTRP